MTCLLYTSGQKLIANFILESYDKAAFMTASRLGKTVRVSESTVVRFAAELGYDGYPAMQKACLLYTSLLRPCHGDGGGRARQAHPVPEGAQHP